MNRDLGLTASALSIVIVTTHPPFPGVQLLDPAGRLGLGRHPLLRFHQGQVDRSTKPAVGSRRSLASSS